MSKASMPFYAGIITSVVLLALNLTGSVMHEIPLWWVMLPGLVGTVVVVGHFVIRAIIAYAALITMVQILYDDYEQRNAPFNPEHLFEEIKE